MLIHNYFICNLNLLALVVWNFHDKIKCKTNFDILKAHLLEALIFSPFQPINHTVVWGNNYLGNAEYNFFDEASQTWTTKNKKKDREKIF